MNIINEDERENRIIKLATEIGLLKIRCKEILEEVERVVNYIDRGNAYDDELLLTELNDDISRYIRLSDKLRKKRSLLKMYTETVRYISIEREDK